MRLTAKAGLIIAGTLVGLLAIVYAVSQLVVLQGFKDVEASEAQQETVRVRNLVATDLDYLNRTNVDWSAWDDTYNYALGANPQYVDANLSSDVFENLRLNAMVFLDAAGNILYGQEYDAESGALGDLSAAWRQSIAANPNLYKFTVANGSTRGLIDAGKPILVSARPIVKTDGTGPVVGAVIFGEDLNDTKLAEFGNLLSMPLTIESLRSTDPRITSLTTASPVSVGVVNGKLSGFALVDDINGQPSVAIRADLERPFYQTGRDTVSLLLFSIFVTGLAFAIVILLLLQRTVISRLARMRSGLRAIAASSVPRGRLPILGHDEISDVAVSVNQFIDALEGGERAVNESSERWRALVENSHDLTLVINPDLTVAFVNSAVEKVFGYKPEEFVGINAMSIVHPDDVQKSSARLAGIAAGLDEPSPTETRVRRADGTYAYMEGIASRIRWGDHEAVLLNARDVSEQKQAQETIAYMAYHDALTGLPNRLLLQDRLEIATAQARRSGNGVCVVSVDLDRFKNVNDLLGHSAGDEMLRLVATRLTSLVRNGDTVARIGGDEFILVFPESDSLDISLEAVQRIVEGFRRPFLVADREIHMTLSAGIARFPDHGEDAEALVINADMALYIVKDNGRNNCLVYSEDMHTRTAEWFAMETALREALGNGEITIYYQPQLRVDTRQIIGAEALVRWQHPIRGLILPSEFIPLAEETGLINLLGDLVLHDACVEALSWPEPLRVSVNVSVRQFERADFVERVLGIVHGSGLPPQRLELEITETVALRDVDRTVEIAKLLTEAGMLLSIDDFGTGNTSLRHLQSLPLHQVKIDQSFIRTLMDSPANAAITASIISLAHELSLSVIAEGVETEEQLEFLRERHCDEFQGFLVSRAVPADQFRKMIAVHEPAVASDRS